MPSDDATGLSAGRRRLFTGLAVLIGLVVGLAALEVALGVLRQRIETSDRQDPGMLRYDATLGWRPTPGWSGRHVHHDFDVRYAIAPAGLRAPFDATRAQTAVRRIGVFGDSFTFGLGVADDETFVVRWNAFLPDDSYAANFGVPGYATDQEVLFAERAVRETLRLTDFVLVVYLANDLIDNRLAWPMQAPQGKPVFELGADGLVLRNTPVPLAPKPPSEARNSFAGIVLAGEPPPGGLDRLLGRAVSSSEILLRLGVAWPPPRQLFPGAEARFAPSLDLFAALVARLRATAAGQGARLHLVVLPGRSLFADRQGYSAQYQEHVRAAILARAGDWGLPVLDLAPVIAAAGGTALYLPYDGHLTADGHRVVAAELHRALSRR